MKQFAGKLVAVVGLLAAQSAQAAPAVPEEGILGPLHAAHQGEIVFAKAEIPRAGDASVPLNNHFMADEPIFARVFLKGTVAKQIAAEADPDNNCKWENRRGIRLWAAVDGGKRTLLESHAPAAKTWGSYTSMIPQTYDGPFGVPPPIVLPNDAGKNQANMLLLLASLADGSHKVEITQEANCVQKPVVVLAKGTLTIDANAKTRSALAKRIKLADGDLKDSDDYKALKKTAQTTFAGAKIRDFRLLETAWDIERGALDQPISRSIISITVYEKAGVCTLIGSKIKEQHMGGGKYGEPQFLNDWDPRLTEITIPCEVTP